MTSSSGSRAVKSVRAPDPLVSFTPVTSELITLDSRGGPRRLIRLWTSVGGIHRIFDARPSCQQEFAVMRVTALQRSFRYIIFVLLIALLAVAFDPARADNPY